MRHSAFGLQRVRDVYDVISPLKGFGIPRRVKRLVERNIEPKGLLGTSDEFSVLFLSPRARLDVL